jgi:hypothetical protein
MKQVTVQEVKCALSSETASSSHNTVKASVQCDGDVRVQVSVSGGIDLC